MPDTAHRRLVAAVEPGKRPGLYRLVAIGAAFGVAYAIADGVLDDLSEKRGLVGLLYAVHEIIDHVMPIAAGVFLGVALHFVRERSEVADSAAASARDLRQKLQRIERDQAAWVVSASTLHEVRNPLHALGLLLDEIGTGHDDDHAIIERARAQMERIEEHLARLRSVTGAGVPEIARIDLTALVEEVGRGYLAPAAEQGVEVRVSTEAGLRAMGDPTYVRIILDNLVRNAIEALRDRGIGGAVVVEVVRGEGEALTRVRDTGPGVHNADQSGMFIPLRSTKEGGLGLGLSIGRALARSMQGDLVLENSVPGSGTTLCLHLPVAP